MKNAIPYIIISFLVFIILVNWIPQCSGPVNKITKDTVYVVRQKIKTQTDTVTKYKTLKGKIEYRTNFDTLATIDTVLIELLKADTIIKYSDRIIKGQDTIIAYQSRIIEFQGDSIEVLNDDLKKEKKKVKIFKVTTIAALLLNLVH
jgi:hypothetical protein